MKIFISSFLAGLAFVSVFSTASLAGGGQNPEIECARQLRMCLRQCNQQEAQAKRAKADCERAAYESYPAGSPQLKQALEGCRRTYNAAMAAVALCRQNCRDQYNLCSEDEGEQQGG